MCIAMVRNEGSLLSRHSESYNHLNKDRGYKNTNNYTAFVGKQTVDQVQVYKRGVAQTEVIT